MIRRLSLAMAFLVAACAPAGHIEDGLVIDSATIIDGQTGSPQANMTIVIEGDRITAVQERASISIPPGARVIDGRGKWVMPGIVEVHSHDSSKAALARALALGVTTVHTMPTGGETLLALEPWSRAAEHPSPRVFLTPWLFSGEWPDNLFPGTYAVRKPRTRAQARTYVEHVHRNGIQQLKMYLEDGALWFPSDSPIPNLSHDVAQEIVRAAHEYGIRVYAHAWRLTFAREAIELGVDALIHPVADAMIDDALWHEMERRRMPWTATFGVLVEYGDPPDYARRVLADAHLRHALTGGEREQLEQITSQGTGCRADLFPILCTSYATYLETVRQNTQAARAYGLPIALGSDTALGIGTHVEMELLSEAGLTEMEILQAATAGGALLLGVEDDVGVIEPGKLADLVLLASDPSQDIRNARDVELTIKGGRVFPRQELLQSLSRPQADED